MSEKEFEQQWNDKALSTEWYGNKVSDLDHNQLIIMIGSLLEEIEFKDKMIDNYLELIGKFKKV